MRSGLIFILAMLSLGGASLNPAHAGCLGQELAELTQGRSVSITISPAELTQAIDARLMNVAEFAFIRSLAEQHGVRIWLFGGSASSFGHYVKSFLKMQKGDTRFQPERFQDSYYDIFRSTQDADLVIDGPPAKLSEAAEAIEGALTNRYGHLQGSKSVWEVRFLRHSRGDKGPILKDFDFMNQHTDSNSTGMIELTRPPKGEGLVRDVRDWENKGVPQFLADLTMDRLHFYHSKKHHETQRFKDRKNPEIFSVIRALTKVFQQELKIEDTDLANMKAIIDSFDPQSLQYKDGYVGNWLEKNGPKLIQNAVNIEYAWNTLEELGLRKKLIAIRNDVKSEGTLAWWMNKEPLRSYKLGQVPGRRSTGKTARMLGLDLVAHDTNSFLTYESITRANTGDPNVLISRNGTPGEFAMFGEGFYVRLGKKGAHDTGYTIRFHIHPEAVEGVDFFSASWDYLVVLNKNALEVVSEGLKFDPIYYYEVLAGKRDVDIADRGIFEKLRLRSEAGIRSLTREQQKEIYALISEAVDRGDSNHDFIRRLLDGFFMLPNWNEFSGFLLKIPPERLHVLLNEKFLQVLLKVTRPDVKEHLLLAYAPGQSEVVAPVARQPGLDLQATVTLLEEFNRTLQSKSLSDIVRTTKLFEQVGPEAEEAAFKVMVKGYLDVKNIRPLIKDLEALLEKNNSQETHFFERIVRISSEQPGKKNLFKGYREILEFKKKRNISTFSEAAKAWLASEGDTAFKIEFVTNFFGTEMYEFFRREVLAQARYTEAVKSLPAGGVLDMFEKLARNKNVREPDSTNALEGFYMTKLEAFQFIEHKLPPEGKTVELGSLEDRTQRAAKLTRSFEMQATPVTQLQWSLVMDGNPSRPDPTTPGVWIPSNHPEVIETNVVRPNRPVDFVSWNAVQEFILRMNRLDPDYEYRLPTEAEWEYAARAGTENFKQDARIVGGSFGEPVFTRDVATSAPNPSGMYDMHGNVWEWVQDGVDNLRIQKGGAINSKPEELRSGSRRAMEKDKRDIYTGFRLVRSPKNAK